MAASRSRGTDPAVTRTSPDAGARSLALRGTSGFVATFSPRVGLFKGLGGLLEWLPERVDTRVASSLAHVVGRFIPGPRANLRDNVRRAMAASGTAVDPALLEHFVDRAFANYGQYWAEGAKLPAIDTEEMARRFSICEGLEHLELAKSEGRGIVIALPHVGSWEWGGSFLGHIGFPMTAVAEALEPPELFEWFREKRRAVGIDIEPLDEHAGTVLLSTLREGGVVGLLCDRDLQNNGVEVEFFGERVTMPAGPATLAMRTNATLVAACCYIGPGRGHHAVISAPIDTTRTGRLREDVARCTQAVALELEWLIKRAPEQWHVLQPLFPAS
jgi:KDO2-lipid IV(A) lauroyltransferase